LLVTKIIKVTNPIKSVDYNMILRVDDKIVYNMCELSSVIST